jgi:prepilin-type N-terminal cleavage/methylation domain-containing protein
MLSSAYSKINLRYSCFKRNAGYDLQGMSRGFTLIELIIVIVIISIAALTAVPMMSSAASVQIRSAANMLTADLEYAKSMAISRGQKYSVVFDKNTESYRIEDQDGNVIPHPVKKGFDYAINFQNDGRLNKVDIVDADFDGTSEVQFDYLGSPYNGNSPPAPLNSGVITLQAGGTTATVSVEAVTGFISIN